MNAGIGNSDGWVPCYSHETLKLHFESLGNHCKLSRFVLVMIGTIIFCPGPFMHPHLQHFNAKLTAMEHILKVLSYHGQIDAQISTNLFWSNTPERSSRAQGEVASTLLFNIFQKGNDHLIHLAWDETISAATQLHCLSMGLIIQLSKLAKSGSWHCHLQWQCTRSCVIPDARKVPIERGWVALHLYATCKFSNNLTLEQWAFEYGLP